MSTTDLELRKEVERLGQSFANARETLQHTQKVSDRSDVQLRGLRDEHTKYEAQLRALTAQLDSIRAANRQAEFRLKDRLHTLADDCTALTEQEQVSGTIFKERRKVFEDCKKAYLAQRTNLRASIAAAETRLRFEENRLQLIREEQESIFRRTADRLLSQSAAIEELRAADIRDFDDRNREIMRIHAVSREGAIQGLAAEMNLQLSFLRQAADDVDATIVRGEGLQQECSDISRSLAEIPLFEQRLRDVVAKADALEVGAADKERQRTSLKLQIEERERTIAVGQSDWVREEEAESRIRAIVAQLDSLREKLMVARETRDINRGRRAQSGDDRESLRMKIDREHELMIREKEKIALQTSVLHEELNSLASEVNATHRQLATAVSHLEQSTAGFHAAQNALEAAKRKDYEFRKATERSVKELQLASMME
jgi:hypothetical protein